jgi:hypothetical protein
MESMVFSPNALLNVVSKLWNTLNASDRRSENVFKSPMGGWIVSLPPTDKPKLHILLTSSRLSSFEAFTIGAS